MCQIKTFKPICGSPKGHLKSYFFKSTFPPKNEQMNSTLLLWQTCFRSSFGGNWRHQKYILRLTDLYWKICARENNFLYLFTTQSASLHFGYNNVIRTSGNLPTKFPPSFLYIGQSWPTYKTILCSEWQAWMAGLDWYEKWDKFRQMWEPIQSRPRLILWKITHLSSLRFCTQTHSSGILGGLSIYLVFLDFNYLSSFHFYILKYTNY